jgi:NADPH:quinone reductase-like Zn-dependent oxidoreductase
LTKTGTFAHVVTKDEYGDQPKPFIEAGQAWTHGPKYTSIEMEPNAEALEHIVEYVADGKIKFHVDSVYTLEEGQ